MDAFKAAADRWSRVIVGRPSERDGRRRNHTGRGQARRWLRQGPRARQMPLQTNCATFEGRREPRRRIRRTAKRNRRDRRSRGSRLVRLFRPQNLDLFPSRRLSTSAAPHSSHSYPRSRVKTVHSVPCSGPARRQGGCGGGRAQSIETPFAAAGEPEIEEKEAVDDCQLPAVE